MQGTDGELLPQAGVPQQRVFSFPGRSVAVALCFPAEQLPVPRGLAGRELNLVGRRE